jgi:hypothetical protein
LPFTRDHTHRSSVSPVVTLESRSPIYRDDGGNGHFRMDKSSADLFCPLHHLRIPHSRLPPSDETKAQDSMHTPPDDFWSDLVPVPPPRWISSSSVVGCRTITTGTDASKVGPNENGMKRGAWKITVDMMV